MSLLKCSLFAESLPVLPMEYNSTHVNGLLQALASHTGQTFDGHGFMMMSEALQEFKEFPEISRRYLSEKLHKRLQKCDTMKIGLMRDKLEKIAEFLGFQNFNDFVNTRYSPIDARLLGCIGNWYSFVRCNSGRPDLLISPVKIFRNGQKVYLRLKGINRVFAGELRLKGSCLFCLLDTGSDKELHITFKIGMEEHPLVLQGTFSGVSSGEDPIGGRELLLREEQVDFDKLHNRKISVNEAIEASEKKYSRIGHYFSNYEKNNLKVSNVSTFDLDDL
jgi:hypothetical protein